MLAHIKPDWLYRVIDWPMNQNGGYPFVSGVGFAVFTPLLYWRHHQCIERRCLRWGHADPEHGHPVCRKHQRKLGDSEP